MGTAVESVATGGVGAMSTLIWILIALIVVVVVIAVPSFMSWQKRKWNLNVEIKLTRSDGAITNGEWGKGFYDSKRGVVMIKRPGAGFKGAVAMKIFDVRRYMQGSDLITVIQAGPEDFRPVLNSSWNTHISDYQDENKPILDEDGNPMFDDGGKQMYETTQVREAIINIKTETGKNKAWKVAWDEAARNAYTIKSFLREQAAAISVSVVVISCFVGFAILWTKLSTVCG